MKTITIGNNSFEYDDQGSGEGPAILLVSGWCQDHRLFKTLAPELAKKNRVLRFNWRGHGKDRKYDGDFGIDEQATDLVNFIEKMELDQVILLSCSHGGWANIEVSDRLGPSRVPRSIVIDWIQTTPPDDFFNLIDDIQDQKKWEDGYGGFFDYWIGDTKNDDIINHVNNEMASFDYEMWARSGREIGIAYRKWGNPMKRMSAMNEKRPITHIFIQPFEEEYHQAQLDFAKENAWYNPQKIPGGTHFPTLEKPEEVAALVQTFKDEGM